jgi:hypothetical protein
VRERWGWAFWGLLGVVGVATCVTLMGAAVSLGGRPLDGVEGDLLFEASRIRAGLRLYVDPGVGALDYGAISARYYVLYPPLWAGFLSLWPSAWALTVGRLASGMAWWGVLGGLALSASARRAWRGPAWLAALFVGGVYSLAEFGGSARPDAVAVGLAGVALARSVRRGRVDVLAGALFALAAWTKPNVLGMGAGAFVACLWLAPRALPLAAAGALGVTGLIVAVLEWASSGSWLAHLVAATGQPLHLSLFVHHLEARGQFFLGFLGLAGFFAWKGKAQVFAWKGKAQAFHWKGSAQRANEDPGARIALAALLVSVAWAFVSFAKVGSAANYWMEPCMAAVVVFSSVEPPGLFLSLSSRARSAMALAALFQGLWTEVGSARATFESIGTNRAHMALLARARSVCRVGEDKLVVSDEPGIELMLDGRLVAHAFPLTYQALRGRYPLGPWIADLERPEVGCVVTAHDRIERPATEIDPDYDYFAVPVRSALFARFAPAAESAGWVVYASR